MLSVNSGIVVYTIILYTNSLSIHAIKFDGNSVKKGEFTCAL